MTTTVSGATLDGRGVRGGEKPLAIFRHGVLAPATAKQRHSCTEEGLRRAGRDGASRVDVELGCCGAVVPARPFYSYTSWSSTMLTSAPACCVLPETSRCPQEGERALVLFEPMNRSVCVDGRVISVPLAWSWRLSDATPQQRANWQLIGDGHGVHWPDIDGDISAEGMLSGVPAYHPRAIRQIRTKPANRTRQPTSHAKAKRRSKRRTGAARG